jgi:hypothetical protein
MKLFKIIALVIIYTSLFSCSSEADKSNDEKNKIYGINGEEIPIRTGPGDNFDKLINQKASAVTGETEYCNVAYDVKVKILETQGKWSKINVVEPNWLIETYIGWIPTEFIIGKEAQEKESIGKLDPKDYEIIKKNPNRNVQNYHVLLKRSEFDKNYVHQFTKQFRKENGSNCNINVYDSKDILSLIGKYPLKDKEYLKFADHLISISTFDAPEVRDWYPYQDFHYKELGGTNWKKEPIK